MLKKKKRFTILSIILVLSMFFTLMMNTDVQANESPTITFELLDEYSSLEAVGFKFPSGTMLFRGLTKLVRLSDGKAVFCIEPGVNASLDIAYEIELEYEGTVLRGGAPSLGNPEKTTLTKDMIEDASLIAFHGWETSASKSSADYVATQILVWQRIWGSELLTSPNDSYIRNLMSEIMDKVNKHDSLPNLQGNNFNTSTRTLSLDLGETVTLTDNNNLINSMSVSQNNSGLAVSKEGNKLTLSANNNSKSGEITFNKYQGINSSDSSLVYTDPHSHGQKFAYLQATRPISYVMNVLVNTEGELVLKKTNENSENLSSAVFELRDNNGNVLKLRKVNDTLYELDSNGSSSFIHIGPETRITKLPQGEYSLKEVSAPVGYVVDGKTHSFSITAGNTSNLTLVNKKTRTEITKSDIAGKEIPGASLEVLDLNGNIIDSWVSKENETHVITGLNVGQTYILRETLAPKGYIKSQDVEFKVNSDGTVTRINMVNELSEIRVSKLDAEGQFLPGVELAITDLEGNLIESWISTNSEHIFRGLEVGKEYILKEVRAPLNYVLADDLRFTVSENVSNNILKLTNDLTTTQISKLDIAGDEIPGASLEILDLEDNTLDSWISVEGETYTIRGLNKGQTYILRETIAPDGYVKSQDIEFTINEDGTVTIVELVNNLTEIRVSKINEDGEFLAGAELAIADLEGNIIETWISEDSEHIIRGLEVDKEYVLIELTAPLNYDISESFNFIVSENTINNSLQLTNELTRTRISKVDITGEEIPGAYMEVLDMDGNSLDSWVSVEDEDHLIRGLNRGQTYILRETLAPDGFVKSQDIEFTINDDGTVTTVEMVNELTELRVSKVSSNGEYLAGVELAITDSDGNVIETWISTDSEHVIRGLYYDNEYTLTELDTPLKYIFAGEILFTISKNSSENAIELINELTTTEISKTDIAGEEIPGAHLEVLDLEGNILDSWISVEDEVHVIRGLNRGYTYILRETIAPNNYVLSQDVEFTVKEDGSVTAVEMVNELTSTEISKTNIAGEEIPGAHLEVLDLEGNIIESWISVEDEVHVISGLNRGQTYIFRETLAPNGYVKSQDVEFTVNEDGSVTAVEMVNELTTIRISKLNNDGEFLPGAELAITDLEGNILETWISTEDEHIVRGLNVDEEYVLKELTAPDAYIIAEDMIFVVNENANENYLTLINDKTTIRFIKIDDNSKLLAGAKLELYDTDGNLIDSWTSTTEEHIVEGLVLAKEYILKEVEAPKGYERAEDLRFTFEDNDEIVELVNKRILHVQTAKTGESLFGPYMIGMSLLLISIALIIFRRKLLRLIDR